MNLNYLEIYNFRQFLGTQRIEFSNDPEKKVTIVIGESSAGKTTIIQIFKWIFYGKCNYKIIMNETQKSEMESGDTARVECKVNFIFNKIEYNIKRSQVFNKFSTKINAADSVLVVDVIVDGISKQLTGREAMNRVREIIHEDLFPYFFLEGESLNKVGKEMASGKSGNNSQFAQAVKGLLGFNYLSNTTKDLKTISKEYEREIEKNTTNTQQQQLMTKVIEEKESIEKYEERLKTIKKESEYNFEKSQEMSEKIVKFADAEEKELKSRALANELNRITSDLMEERKTLFSDFSTKGYMYLMNSLLNDADDAFSDEKEIDKGIPGINAKAIKFLLANGECLCGKKLTKDCPEWGKLEKLIEILPPKSIGYDIKAFKGLSFSMKDNGEKYYENYKKSRKRLGQLKNDYKNKKNELDIINEAITGLDEVSEYKKLALLYKKKYADLLNESGTIKERIAMAENLIEASNKELDKYSISNVKVAKLTKFKLYCDHIYGGLVSYCDNEENLKKKELKNEINIIFDKFYNEKISIDLDEDYNIQIITNDNECSEDFSSGGQEVVIALAFIGAIIKLNGKIKSSKDTKNEIIEAEFINEIYPLIMDAPTSNFGMRQMKSFCQVMPEVTNQIIVFINDKDGPVLEDNMMGIIGKKWTIKKLDSYHAKIEEGN